MVLLSHFSYFISSNNISYNDGNVGIGITNPTQTLDVNGSIKSNSYKLQLGELTYMSSQIALALSNSRLWMANQDIRKVHIQ